jgi:imidazolonepropionase-like amidohydrolase
MNGSFPHREYISPSVMDLWRSLWTGQSDLPDFIWKNWVQMVADMNAAGIPLMIGTDLMLPGILPGFSVHEEMAIWQEAGIPAADILRSATLVPVQFVGFGDRLGSIRQGKSASMLLIRGNPLEDVRNAQQIEAVFLHGQYFNRTDLDRLLDEARELARGPIP